jgi:hypothetical protein
MAEGTRRRERLHTLIDWALAYRRISRSELAKRVGRDHGRLYPENDNPTLDFLLKLSETLDWEIELVVEYLRDDPDDIPPTNHEDYAALEEAAKAAGRKGDYTRVAELGRQMFGAARTPDEKARACRREGAGWGEQVRVRQALAAYRRGLRVPGVSRTERLALEVSLANTYYNLWELTEALGIAHAVLSAFDGNTPTSRIDRFTEAFAHYVRGNALRRLMCNRSADLGDAAVRAKDDLERAQALHLQMARDYDADYLAGIAHACQGALLEVSVELGECKPQNALDEILADLAKLGGSTPWPEGNWLESYGWWCDFGANIAFRHLTGPDLQRTIAVLSGKLVDIGRRLDNSSLLDRAAAIEYALHERLSETTGVTMPRTLDAEDVAMISRTIGRIPQFRGLGWDLIDRAIIVPNAKRV